MKGANRILEPVPGAPYQPGDAVRVVAATDPDVHDVTEHIGCTGTVVYLEYECGSGQHFPDDPMIGVALENGVREEFWPEELAAA